MKSGWFKLFLAVFCLFCLSSCVQSGSTYPKPESYTEDDIPYDAMSEEDAAFIWRLWNVDGWASYLVGDPGLQEAIFADGKCVYVNQLGGLGATDTIPEDARYLGQTTVPCEEYTTPQIDLQTNFAPEGCAVYKGWYTVRSGDRERTFDMFFVQTEPDSEYYALMFVSSYTRPPYYDEGRWMLTPLK